MGRSRHGDVAARFGEDRRGRGSAGFTSALNHDRKYDASQDAFGLLGLLMSLESSSLTAPLWLMSGDKSFFASLPAYCLSRADVQLETTS